MEIWECVVERWTGDIDVSSFNRLTQAAETVLKEDLADFEIEWVTWSLLHEPIHLLELIESYARNSAWTKPLTDAFKLITKLVERYPECSDQYHDDIVKACQVGVGARARGAALQCLAARAARCLRAVRVSAYVAELEAPLACKASLAQLLGVICESYPEEVAEEVGRVWRAFLNLLDVNKNTEVVRRAALVGAGRVLTCFGSELPLAEVALLYPALTTHMDDVSLELLERHATLFRERLAGDAALRRRLWAAAGAPAAAGGGEPAARAAQAVTTAALQACDTLQSILEHEILPLTCELVPRVRFGALRVACAARVRYGPAACRDVTDTVDVYELEFQLRTDVDNVTEDVALAVSWCVEWRVPHAGALLQTAILNHERLPAARLADIVHAGLRAEAARDPGTLDLDPSDSGLEFLVGESGRAPERYVALWRAACAGAGGVPLADALACRVAALLARHARAPLCELPASLECLLTVCAHALADVESERAARVLAAPLCAALHAARALPAAALLLLPLLPHTEEVKQLYQRVEVTTAPDEASVCAGALAALHAPPGTTPPETVLTAVELVLCRRDAEPATLSLALRSVARLRAAGARLHPPRLHRVLQLAERRRARLARSQAGAKDDRILCRDLDVFLGKYGGADEEEDGCGAACDEIDSLVAELGDDVSLLLPADDCQWSLKRVVKLALEHEDQDSLVLLTALICDHPSMKREEPPASMLGALARVVAARAAGAARGEVPPPATPDVPPLAPYLLQRMCACVSGGARRVLRDVLQPLLRGAALSHVAELVTELLAPSNALVVRAGALQGAAAAVAALRAEPAAARALLAPLLAPLAAAPAVDTQHFTAAAEATLHLRDVFSESALESVVDSLLRVVLELDVTPQTRMVAYRQTVRAVAEFIYKLYGIDEKRRELMDKLLEMSGDSSDYRWVYVTAVFKRVLRLEARAVLRAPRRALPLLRAKRATDFDHEAVLIFVAEFADVLLDEHHEDTMVVLCDVISALAPRAVSAGGLRDALAECARVLGPPTPRLARALDAWTSSLPLQHVAERIQNFDFTVEDARCVGALRRVLEAWPPAHAAHALTAAAAAARPWPDLVLRLYAQAPEQLQEHAMFLQDAVWAGLRLGRAGALPALLAADARLTRSAFARAFMPAIYTFLLRRPFVLCTPELAACCPLLRDVAACCPQQDAPALLDLADELWERYAAVEDVRSCRVLVSALVRAGAGEGARCVRWAAGAVGDAVRSLAERAALLPELPRGDLATTAYVSFAGALPARASECVGAYAHALRAVLETASRTPAPPPPLLDLLISLAAGTEFPGWCERAMESCMASLAVLATTDTLRAVHACVSQHVRTLAPVDRLLVPLIGSCSSRVCELYFSAMLPAVLRAARAPGGTPRHRARALNDNTVAVTLLRLMFEKVCRGSLESPASVLHCGLIEAGSAARPWLAAREACKLVVSLQGKTLSPPDDAPELAEPTRVFHQRAYNALCALVCVWRADARLYTHVVGDTWDLLVGSESYSLPLRPRVSHRRLDVASGGEADGAVVQEGVGTLTSSSRLPRVFLRTLSESAYSFDLIDEMDEPSERIELVVGDSAVNRHPCAGALSALLRHLAGPTAASPAAGGGGGWLAALCNALTTAALNVRWLLAQCVVNVRTELRAHARELTAALLACVRDTHSGTLNSLHVDILETVAQWHSPPAPGDLSPPPALLSACASLVVRACVDAAARRGVHYALLDTVGAFLRAFPDTSLDWENFRPHLDGGESGEACVRVLSRAVRAGAYVPHLVPALLERIVAPGNRQISATCKLFGECVRSLKDESEAGRAWQQYSAAAARARRDNVTRYVNMLHYARCTDLTHFKNVADTAMKVPAERGKCVSVLAASMLASAGERRASPRDSLPAELRSEIARKCPALAFDESFPECADSPAAKRPRVDRVTSRVLATRVNERAFASALEHLPPNERWDRLHEKLANDDSPLRFVECFYACVYLPAKYPDAGPGHSRGRGRGEGWGARLAALLALFLRRARTNPRHLRANIPAPAVARGVEGSACGSRAATLRTRTATLRTLTARTRPLTVASRLPPEQVAIPVDAALDILLRFGESCWESSAWLVVEAWRACGGAPEHSSTLADMLADTLAAAPCLLRLALDFAPLLPDITGWVEPVEVALRRWARSEAGGELRVLDDELRLRTPPHPALRPLGAPINDDDDVTPSHHDAEFSLEALISSFGSLSDWWHRTERARRAAEARLPPLWTSREHFRRLLQRYQPEDGWFARSVRVRRGARDVTRHLRAAAAWPRDRFHVAAVVEAMETDEGSSAPALRDESCLAEWAARLQLRASGTDCDAARSRSHALAWTRAALVRRLPHLALQCIKVVTAEHGLPEGEALGWVVARARALRDTGWGPPAGGGEGDQAALLQKALRVAESGAQLAGASCVRDVLELAALVLQLHEDLKSLTDDIVENALGMAAAACERDAPSAHEGDAMRELCELAMLHYDDTWDTRDPDTSVVRMCDVLSRCASETGAAVLLARVDEDTARSLGEDAAGCLLDTMLPLAARFPAEFGSRLARCLPALPAAARARHATLIHTLTDTSLDKWRLRLQLLCGAEQTLLAHCETLERALQARDGSAWRCAFSQLRAELWEEESVGADHRALRQHRSTLEPVEEQGCSPTDENVSKCRAALRAVAGALRAAAPRARRSVAALCPALAEPSRDVTCALAAILRLPPHEVLGLDDEIPVFVDSVRAPGVLSVRLSRARRRRYLLKREHLALDAAAASALLALTPDHPPPEVILLSAECGLIEFLEGYERLGDLIRGECDLTSVGRERAARRNDELVLAPAPQALRNFALICEQVPPQALRGAFRRRSADAAHFLRATRRHARSLGGAALGGWLLGLGDRHAHNVLVACGAGRVRCVDAGALFQRAAAAELPPARLTAQLQAPAHHGWLEAELQWALHELRARRRRVRPRLALAFAHAGDFAHEVSLVSELLSGRWLANHVTARALHSARVPHAQHYLQLLEELFAHVRTRDKYTVEEQVSSLMLLCTAPRVLAVTRSEWEPWL